jgi:broad specificity phosphatase PhoE
MTSESVVPTPSTLLQLYLIRHGETDWSLSGQHTGLTDVPLTGRGEDEARALEPILRSLTFTRVLTSPLQRAWRTCELAGLGPAAETEPDLVEWDYGEYEGRRSLDIHKERPGWNVFRDGCPGGEMPGQVSDRADRVIARLCEMDSNVALFSHGHFGCVLAARWIGMPAIDGQHFALSTASLSILGHRPNHASVRVIAQWNETLARVART